MRLNFENIYDNFSRVFQNNVIDLIEIEFFDPWAIGLVSLKAIENSESKNKKLVLPSNLDALGYLKQMHFDEFMQKLGYSAFLEQLSRLSINENDNPNIHEIIHCPFRNDFEARLQSGIRRMFQNFGLKAEDEQRATAIVGELGNNVFDHNAGSWQTDIGGAIIVAQHYPANRSIEVVVADPGVGFFNSLKAARPGLQTDSEAIKLGLSGVTGRIGENRGNGLRLIQSWTINKFNGSLRIHSGKGLVIVDRDGIQEKVFNKILGTIAEFVVKYQ